MQVQEIRQAILDNGELTKDDIRLTWSLSEVEYAVLKAELSHDPDIEPGAKGVGGFQVRQRRWRRPPESEEPEEQIERPVESWQRVGAERLARLLTVSELDKLLGRKLSNALRLDRKRKTGRDAPSRLAELADALVVKYDRDLFSSSDVRAAVARAAGTSNPGKWRPGKASAAEFVHAAGFPFEFAGLPADEAPPSFEYLEGRVNLPQLLDFQEEVRKKLLDCLERPSDRAILTLPTGAGKTRAAVEAIRDWMTVRSRRPAPKARQNAVLWLAHSSELCDQAYECFRQVWQYSEDVCPLLLFRFWGHYTHDFDHHREQLWDILEQPTVLVSTPNRIVNLIEDADEASQNVLQILLCSVSLIVIDEAHRAATQSYRSIIDKLAGRGSETRLIGLTATPYRKEYLRDGEVGTRELSHLFRRELIEPADTLGENARLTLQKRGVLARIIEEFIDTTTILQAPEFGAGVLSEDDIEKIDHALRIRADNPTRRQTVFERIVELAGEPGSSILYFGPSVSDAECIAFLLRQAGIPAAFVGALTRDVNRRRIVSEFKRGQYKVLCNCEVLTTGFDAPKVTHVVVARPTVSGVLYEQMIGRGLRGPAFGGTEQCVIVNCRDSYRSRKPALGYEAFRYLWGLGR